ncbi:hypothetical protein [Candidatus Chlorohelix sp.]|uniref:hypothetical protein n=1 Tax=Candidatus Chlorohelix sp. TaxID=3139201 RepID=UPI00302BBBAD
MKKYEKEIREILEKMDTFIPETPSQEKEREREPKRKPTPTNIGVLQPMPPRPIRAKHSFGAGFGKWLREHKITGSLAYLIFGFFFIILGLMVSENFSSIQIVAQLLALTGLALYIAPIFIRFFGGNPDKDSTTQYWRGDLVEQDSVFTWKKLKSLIRGGRNRGKNDPWNRRNRW